MRLKISDGDLLMISHSREMSEEAKRSLAQSVDKWLKSKGLNNVLACLVGGDVEKIYFDILSVNDVFEEQVLKGDKDE